VKRKQIRFVGYCLAIALIFVLTMVIPVSCSCSSKPSTTALPSTITSTYTTNTTTTTARTTTTSTPARTTTTLPTTIPTSAVTILTSFPYQGSGTGVFSGQVKYNNKIYPVDGTLTVAIDANGVVTGSMTGSSGTSVTVTQRTLQVDANGNITGSSTFTVNTTSITFSWQGKVTVSGSALSMQGTWTGEYGSGTFSGTGTTSK
jgi:hypothetical protein